MNLSLLIPTDKKELLTELIVVSKHILQVKLESYRLLRLLDSKSTKKLSVVCDFKVVGPGYGDFLQFVFLTFMLQKSFKVQFVFVMRPKRPDWRLLDLDSQQQTENHFIRMVQSVIKNPSKNIKFVSSLSQCEAETQETHTIFRSRVFGKRGIWHHCSNLSNDLFMKMHCGSEQLFGTAQFDCLKKIPNGKFVAWHVRIGNVNPGIQVTATEFMEQYSKLRRIIKPSVKIVLLSSPAGLEELKQISFLNGLELITAREYSDDFVGDLNLVHRSNLYLQFGNGGMYIAALNSSVNYFLTKNVFVSGGKRSGEWTRVLSHKSKFLGFDFSKSEVRPWQTNSQIVQKGPFLGYPKVEIDWRQFEELVERVL